MPVIVRYSDTAYDQEYYQYVATVEARELAFASPEQRAQILMSNAGPILDRINAYTFPPAFVRCGNSGAGRKRIATILQPEFRSFLRLSDDDVCKLTELANSEGVEKPFPAGLCYVHGVVWGEAVCKTCKGCNRCTERCHGCERCARCCTICTECPGCDQKVAEACTLCANCSDCCECRKCESCGPIVSGRTLCDICNRCSACRCGCDRCQSFHPSAYTWPMPGQRMAGLEVEFNRAPKFRHIRMHTIKWGAAVHTDGSCGFECVTSPAAGEKLSEQIAELGAAMRLAEATADHTCGVHVHIDAHDLSLHAIRRLSAVYGLVEPIMYIIGGQERAKIHYCAPNGVKLLSAAHNEKWPSVLLRSVYKDKVDLKKESKNKGNFHKKDHARYVGLNMCPWVAGRVHKTSDTTVEFRLHKNSLDAKKLNEWAKLLIQIVDYAKTHKWEDVLALPTDAARALCVVAPNSAAFIVKRIRDWRHSHKRAARLINLRIPKQLSTLKKPRKAFWVIECEVTNDR
jgi:hypothetical protein